MLGQKCKAAVFVEPGKPLEERWFTLPEKIESQAALCKIKMSTICGSDLHTINGRRQEPIPLILGHEIIGEIVALGSGLKTDGFGNKLGIGDRVSWSIMASCGQCFFCCRDLPQKCVKLHKYGHTSCNEPPYLTGGYAEYIYLSEGTAIYKVPENVSDEMATPANCALSTVVNAKETIGLYERENVLIQGAGLLGLNLIALAIDAGAKNIIVTDIWPERLEMAKQFGATECLNVKILNSEKCVSRIEELTKGYGVDVAFECSGATDAFYLAIDSLRIGGRYLIAGLVTPSSNLLLDGNALTRKCLTIKGIHNYHPRHLGMALRFLERNAEKFPYNQLVQEVFSLSAINEAVKLAQTGKYIRVAISSY